MTKPNFTGKPCLGISLKLSPKYFRLSFDKFYWLMCNFFGLKWNLMILYCSAQIAFLSKRVIFLIVYESFHYYNTKRCSHKNNQLFSNKVNLDQGIVHCFYMNSWRQFNLIIDYVELSLWRIFSTLCGRILCFKVCLSVFPSVCLFVCLSVTNFSQNWLIRFFCFLAC